MALFDQKGPFGNPSADSFRTRIREETSRILFLFFAPIELSVAELEQLTLEACGRMVLFCGGSEKGRGLLPVKG